MTMKSKVLGCVAAALAFALPAFGEDAYIESDGSRGAGINTGFFVGPQTKIEIDFQLTTNSQNQVRLFGAKGVNGDDSTPECESYVGKNGSGTECFSYICGASGGTRQASNFKAIDTLRHKIVLDFYGDREFQVWTDGSKSSKALSDFPANRQKYPLTFFCKNYSTLAMYSSRADSLSFPAKIKIYSFKIWDGGVLVRDYVPRVKGGVAGFHETCSGQFVMGENIAAFSSGGDVTVEKDDPYVAMPDNDVMTASGVSGKSMYFDTGYVFKPNSRVELDYALLTPEWTSSTLWNSEAMVLFAQGSDQLLYLMAYGKNIEGRYYRKFGKAYEGGIAAAGLDTAYGVRRTASMDKKYLRIVTAGYTNYSDGASAANVISQNLSSATLRVGGRVSNSFTPMRIYGLKIFETDNGVENLVRDYVPVISNNIPRLVDTLNAGNKSMPTVYNGGNRTNIVFDAGGDIKGDEAAKEAYLKFDGLNTRGHYILTDDILTKDSRVELDFSLWSTTYNGQQRIFDQSTANRSNCILARLYINSAWSWSVMYGDNHASAPSGIVTVPIDNNRLKFTIDSYNSRLAVTNAGVEVYNQAITTSRTWETGVTNLWIGGSYGGATAAASMRLYSFRIYKKGVLDRNYVPCVRNGVAGLYETCGNKFLQVLGGKVSGATLKGEAFQIAPQPAKLTSSSGRNTATLTCLAAGAQSYEWYENGVLLPGEASDALTLAWTNEEPHVRTYSVVPVYTVFNETVKGDPVTAEVEYAPMGVTIVIR